MEYQITPYTGMDGLIYEASEPVEKLRVQHERQIEHGLLDTDNLPTSSKNISFDLPLSSDKLFLLSRGGAGGLFKVVQSPELGKEKPGVAKVVVVAKYWNPAALHGVMICRMSRGEAESGVGIFVS